MVSLPVELIRALSGSKNVEHRALNTLGIQVARTVAARGLHNARREPPHPPELAAPIAELRAHGLLLWPDFLPEDEFCRVRAEAFSLLERPEAPRKRRESGTNLVEVFPLLELDRAAYPGIFRFLGDARLRGLLSAAEKRSIDLFSGHRVLERLTQNEGNESDVEAVLHVDTFFHTHKFWLYLDEVREEHGPLVYVPGSHRLSLDRLRRSYRESLERNQGSRRITDEELATHGVPEQTILVPGNTLVIANTCGYHRRKVGRPGMQRHALHGACRFNPFFAPVLDADAILSRRNAVVRRVLDRLGYAR